MGKSWHKTFCPLHMPILTLDIRKGIEQTTLKNLLEDFNKRANLETSAN